jgi:sulfotransferase family protein
MKVIGAGLPRTATTSQAIAYEQLGFGPCYHMRDVLMDMNKGLSQWEAVASGNPDWETIFGDARSTCDWPGARYYKELLEYYPDSKVVLSVRGAEGWVQSMRDTIWAIYFGDSVMHHLCEARAVLDPLWKRFMDLMIVMTWRDPDGALAPPEATFDDAGLAAAMDRWNDRVKADVPSDRLLVWEPREGWGPLCEFLEVSVPDEPLPNVNDTAAFKEGIMGGAIGVVNAWWDQRERPSSGLHDTPLD